MAEPPAGGRAPGPLAVGSARSSGPAAGYAAMLAAAVLWATIGVATVRLSDLGLPAASVGAWRALLGGACFALDAVVARRRPGWPVGAGAALRSRWPAVGLFTAVAVVLFYAALPLAVDTGGIALAYVLLYTAPVWVAVGSVLWLGERLDRAGVVAIAVSVAGVAMVAVSAGGTIRVSAVSIGWGLASGLAYASYYLLGRRLFDSVPAVLLYAVALPIGGVVLAVLAGLPRPTAAMLPWLLWLGVACTWLPWRLFAVGMARVPSSRAVVVAMVEPVLAAVIGVSFFGERLGALGVVGAVAVVSAATAVAARQGR